MDICRPTPMRSSGQSLVPGGDGLTADGGQMPEWRLKICSMFCDSAERAITMSQPASCA